MKFTLLLVDDHKMIRDGIKSHLAASNFEVVGEAENGQEGLDFLDQNKVDVVMTDILMPVMNGIEMTKAIKDKFPDQYVIALSMMGESQHIKQMLAVGVSGYLLKNCGEEEIHKALEKVVQGETYYSPEVTQIILDNMRGVRKKPSSMTLQTSLTTREKEVLSLILKERTNQEIADELFISIRTVDAHKRNLLEKTGSRNVAGLVLHALENNLLDNQ